MPRPLHGLVSYCPTMVRVVVQSQVISEATLRVAIPWYLRLYTFPFLGFYLLFASIRYVRHNSSLWSEESNFFAFVPLAGHALTFLATRWSTAAQTLITTFDASELDVADCVRITPIVHRGNGEIVPLIKENPSDVSTWTFKYQGVTYAAVESHPTTFAPLAYPCSNEPLISTFLHSDGLTQEEVEQQMKKFGTNEFPIPIPTFVQLLSIHLTAPLAICHAFCAVLRLFFEEYLDPPFLLLLLVCSESTTVWKRLKVLKNFRDMTPSPFDIWCKRDGDWVTISTDKLVPGDVVSVGFNERMSPADILLIQGTCIVDEAPLSGESMALSKEAIDCFQATESLKVDSVHKGSMLYGGTKLLQSCRCIGIVQRTGFGTSQGQVIRDMVFSPEQVSANNLESYLFMGSLLTLSMVISGYVWAKGVEEGLKKSRLLPQCLSIITDTVPVSLPMELSSAISVSLNALSYSGISCAEPFRIPFAGRVDTCCFDKTGTLTNTNLVFKGVAGVGPYVTTLVNVTDVERETTLTLATAQALVKFDKSLVLGDPMEKVVLQATGWTLEEGNTVCDGSGTRVVIQRRFPFTSTLRRMSTVSRVLSENESQLICAVKGAPETIEAMLAVVPEHYGETYKFYARSGHRVLALGFKKMDDMTDAEIGELTQDQTERNLSFAGFLVFDCPLEEGVPKLIETLIQSCHRCIMISGDNPLTAVRVATKVKIVDRDVLILDLDGNPARPGALAWRTPDDRKIIPANPDELDPSLFDQYDICITGAALQQYECRPEAWNYLVQNTWVYARVSPSQKELILRSLKSLGYITSMVGDGTNDIGALKQAHVGISLNSTYHHIFPADGQSFTSCAAPFSCKSVVAVHSILKQGRRALVVTIQAYKILALNGLIRACSLAVQYLHGIRIGNRQKIIAGLSTGFCTFCISRTKPAKRLSQERPLKGILNSYVLLSVALQSALHIVTLMYIANLTRPLEVQGVSDMEAEFEPSLLSSAIYLLSHSQTVSTFVINYQGMPFRKGIRKNPALCLGLIGAAAIVIVSLASSMPQASRWLQVTEMSHHFRTRLAATMILDYIGCLFVERGCRYLLVSPEGNGLVTKRQKQGVPGLR